MNDRTNQQNAWYWACIVTPFADYLTAMDDPHTPDEVHEHFKSRFLLIPTIDYDTGELLGERVGSTRDLSTVEMADYCERIRKSLAKEHGFVVDDPDPMWRNPRRVA